MIQHERSRSETDITTVFGTVIGGSNPSESTELIALIVNV